MLVQLGRIAGRIGAGVGIAADDPGEQQLVVSGALGAIEATSRSRDKLRVLAVEGRVFENEHDVLLNPLLEMTDGQQDAFRFAPASIRVLIARGKGLFLLRGLEFCQQERMTDADLVFREGFDH